MHSHQLHAISLLCRQTAEEIERLHTRFDEMLEEDEEEEYDDDDSQASVYEGEYEIQSDATEAASEYEEEEIEYVDNSTQTDTLTLREIIVLQLKDELLEHSASLCELLSELQGLHQPGEEAINLTIIAPKRRR